MNIVASDIVQVQGEWERYRDSGSKAFAALHSYLSTQGQWVALLEEERAQALKQLLEPLPPG